MLDLTGFLGILKLIALSLRECAIGGKGSSFEYLDGCERSSIVPKCGSIGES